MKTLFITLAAAYFLVTLPAMVILGRIIRAGTGHLDREPLPPHSLRGGRPWGGPI